MKSVLSLIAALAALLSLSTSALAVDPVVLIPGTTVSISPGTSVASPAGSLFQLTPAQATTINSISTAVIPHQKFALEIITSGTTSYTVTFGANFNGPGTLECGTVSGVTFMLEFEFDGTTFQELTRKRCSSSVIALGTTGAVALGWGEGVTDYTVTPSATITGLNAAVVGRQGTEFNLVITTSGTSAYTIAFSTGFNSDITGTGWSSSTFTTSNTSAVCQILRFRSNGSKWILVAQTPAQ